MKNGIYEKIVDHITENQEKFYRLAYSYVQNKEDALDVVQNAICQALDHYETVKNENAVRTWFYRILVNESLLFLRQRKREVLAGDEKAMEIPYYERRYDSSGEEIYEQISRLEEDVQCIVKLRFFEELTLKEISDVMQMNLNTVKAKLYRGLKQLKQNIKEADL